MSAEPSGRRRVLIAGGGIAALEALLALRDLAEGRVEVTLAAPEVDFTIAASPARGSRHKSRAIESARREAHAIAAAAFGPRSAGAGAG